MKPDRASRREQFNRWMSRSPGEMDRDQLGQLIRFYGHFMFKVTQWEDDPHRRGDGFRDVVKDCLDEWRRRGYEFGPDKVWAQDMMKRYEEYRQTRKKIVEKPSADAEPIATDIMSVMRSRRSVRFWRRKRVERHKIEAIVAAGTEAPCSCNRMTWRFYVVENDLDQMKDGAADTESMLDKAPVIIYVAIDERLYPQVYAPAVDAGLAIQNMLLAAHALGLGASLIYDTEVVEEKCNPKGLDIPDHCRIYCDILLGYPGEVPPKPERVNVDEVLTYVKPTRETDEF
ncbi:MAG: nitroreductase family protein [Phycisphaerae bacterium]|nr:nitroreductase family protein [Phycisphaerae bacterium]